MNQDVRTLLSLVATGRMSSAEAERWLAANQEERLAKSENRWIFAALAMATLAQFWPGLTVVASQWTMQLPQALTNLQHALSSFAVVLF
jgi:type VI protein secretion system component VasF